VGRRPIDTSFKTFPLFPVYKGMIRVRPKRKVRQHFICFLFTTKESSFI
jgi:hypothetical protein